MIDERKQKALTPLECENCGRRPMPQDVIDYNGNCLGCGDNVIAYTIDTAEYIIQIKTERDQLVEALEKIVRNSGPNSIESLIAKKALKKVRQ